MATKLDRFHFWYLGSYLVANLKAGFYLWLGPTRWLGPAPSLLALDNLIREAPDDKR